VLKPVVSETRPREPASLAGVASAAARTVIDLPQKDEIDLREIGGRLARRKLTILSVALLFFVLVLVATLMKTPTYRASVTLELNPNEGKVLEYDVQADKVPVNDKDFYQTEYELLKSRNLAERVINSLGLNPELSGGGVSRKPSDFHALLGQLRELVTGKPDEPDQKLGLYPPENRLLENLTVQPVKNSRLVTLHYVSTDPEMAAIIVNSFATNFISMNIQRRTNATAYAKTFLENQLELAKSKLEDSETRLIAYAKNKRIFSLDDKQDLISGKLQRLNEALTEAEARRIAAENLYRNTDASAGQGRVRDSQLIQRLKERRLELMNEYQDKVQIYRPDFPSVLALRRQLDEVEAQLDQEITQEVSTSAAMLKSAYMASRGDEEAIRAELERYKQELLLNRDKSIGYNTLSREVETNRELYDGLLQRFKEVSVAGYAEPNTVSIVDPATIPWATNSPNLPLSLLIGLGGGLVLGMIAAFLLDFLDDRIHDTVELDQSLGLPLLGSIPMSRSRLRPDQFALMSHDQPRTPIAEAFRTLKTNLLFASRGEFPRVVAITSAGPSEGKTTTAINLATSLAQQGKTVLLIDGDLRCPALHKRLKLDKQPGLINFLMGEVKLKQTILQTGIPHIKVIQAGDQPVTHQEVFSREKIGLMLQILTQSTVFDHLILDCPPVMGFGDALILGNCADATLLTLQVDKTCKRPLANAYKRLIQAHSNVAGAVIFSHADRLNEGYYYYQDRKRLEVS